MATQLAAYRGSTVGFVFQHFGLLGTLTALENVELAMAVASLPRAERTERARSLLDAVGLGPRARHLPSALSGGESQRVAIARALANAPRLILADEPTGNLDDESTAIVLELLGSLADGHGCTLVVATHDDAVASRWDRRLVPRTRGPGSMTWPDAWVMAVRGIRRRFSRAVLTVAAVALAAALLTSLLIAVGAARNRVFSAVSKGGPLTGIQVLPNAPDFGQLDSDSAKPARPRPIDDSVRRQIQGLRGVTSVVPLLSTGVFIVPAPPENANAGPVPLAIRNRSAARSPASTSGARSSSR